MGKSRLLALRIPAPIAVECTDYHAMIFAAASNEERMGHADGGSVLTRLPTTLDRDILDLLPHRWKPKG